MILLVAEDKEIVYTAKVRHIQYASWNRFFPFKGHF